VFQALGDIIDNCLFPGSVIERLQGIPPEIVITALAAIARNAGRDYIILSVITTAREGIEVIRVQRCIGAAIGALVTEVFKAFLPIAVCEFVAGVFQYRPAGPLMFPIQFPLLGLLVIVDKVLMVPGVKFFALCLFAPDRLPDLIGIESAVVNQDHFFNHSKTALLRHKFTPSSKFGQQKNDSNTPSFMLT
jgi:hypothetical protein